MSLRLAFERPVALPALLLAALAASAAAADTVELLPRRRAGWTAHRLVAPLTGLFRGGTGYWYDPRRIEVETTPPGALLDLFYVRGNFQQAFEQARAPVTILLPSRIEASDRDSVTIRALADGYRQRDVHVRVRSRRSSISIELEPLPNALEALSHVYLAGRGSLTFLTAEALAFRLQRAEDGFSVVLPETAISAGSSAAVGGVHSALISGLSARQLGEDLMVRVSLRDAGARPEIRSRQSYDPIRRLHAFALDLVPPDGGVAGVRRARAALARIRPGQVSRCALAFDAALREQLDPADLARALAPAGRFTDPYLRAALERLGEVSPGGVVTLGDGSAFDTSVPIELSAAASQAGAVRGYLALLRRFVAEMETEAHRRSTLRGLVAPELPAPRFDAALDAAEQRERACERAHS